MSNFYRIGNWKMRKPNGRRMTINLGLPHQIKSPPEARALFSQNKISYRRRKTTTLVRLNASNAQVVGSGTAAVFKRTLSYKTSLP